MAMAPSQPLPFKIGQQAESRSFRKGFRGAWFRCTINKLSHSKDSIKALLEYYDYPGEKKHLTQLYQKPSRDSVIAQLILRPCFPPLYRENQTPDLSTISNVIVIVNGVWKVGDLVDWWSDGCYWSGRVSHVLGRDKVQVDLPDPPAGEGKSYEALCTDLRPSLDWSLEHGWTVPDSGTSCSCARVVQPQSKGEGGNENCTLASNTRDSEQENSGVMEHAGCASGDVGTSMSSCTLASSLLSPAGNIDPRVNEISRHCSTGEDAERDMEVQSTKMSLELDLVTSGSNKGSSMLAASTLPLEVKEIARPDSGREENEGEIVQSTTMNFDSDYCRSERTSSFGTSSLRSRKEEDERNTVQADLLDSDAYTRGTVSSFDKTLDISCGSFLPPVECIGRETNEASTQSSRIEVTEQTAGIRSTSVNLDLDAAGKETVGGFDTSSVTPSPFNSPETNCASVQSLGMGETEKEVQYMSMILDSNLGKKQITNLLDKASVSHEVRSSSNVTKFSCREDQYNFRLLPKRSRITENHCPTSVAEAKVIEQCVELEELVNKIKWLKRLIIFGLQWSNGMKPSWKFLET